MEPPPESGGGFPREVMFKPRPLFLRLLQAGGARGDTFTYGRVLFYLGEYIKAKGLYDKEQQHIVCCSGDLLGIVFATSSFSLREHRKLCAMIYRNLIKVNLPEPDSPPRSRRETKNLHELGRDHKEPVRELWQDSPTLIVGTRPSTSSERKPLSETDPVDEQPCAQPRSQDKSQSSLPLPLGKCGLLGATWSDQSRRCYWGPLTSTPESVQEPREEHLSSIVDPGLSAFSGRRRPSSETENSLNELRCGQLRKRKKSDSSTSFSFGGNGIVNGMYPGQNNAGSFSSSPESMQEAQEEHPLPSVDTRPSVSSGRRPPGETEDSVDELPCGQARDISLEKSESSISPPGDGSSAQSVNPLLLALLSSPPHSGSATCAGESVQELCEEPPSSIVNTSPPTSSGRRPSGTGDSVDTLPRGQPGDLQKSECSIAYSCSCCSASSGLFSGQSSSSASAIPSSSENSSDSGSDQFSVEYDVESVESMESEPYSLEEGMEPGQVLERPQFCMCDKVGRPQQQEEASSSRMAREPSPHHSQTGGRERSGPPGTQEMGSEARPGTANSRVGGPGNSHSAPSSSLSVLEPCIICLSQPKNGCIVHGFTGHLVTCYMCARRLQRRDKPCPVCRQPIHLIVFIYLL